MSDRIVDIERAVLSSIIFDNNCLSSIELKEEYFLDQSNKAIFQTILELAKEGKPISDDFILNKLDKKYEKSLLVILSANPIVNINAYVEQIKESYFKRQIGLKLNNISQNLPTMSLVKIEQELNMISKSSHELSFKKALTIFPTNFLDSKQPEFFLSNVVPIQKNEITMLSASGGSGKSFLGLFILCQLKQQHNLKVFGFFSEDDIRVTKYRLEELRKVHTQLKDIEIAGKDSRPKSFLSRDKNRNLVASDYFYQFKKEMKEYDVILLDPLIAFLFEDENSNTESRVFMNLINEWCVKDTKTVIFIHHHSKGQNATVRGASAFIDAIRLHYTVTIPEKKRHLRQLNLEKTNHFQGKSEFLIPLFEPSEDKQKVPQDF